MYASVPDNTLLPGRTTRATTNQDLFLTRTTILWKSCPCTQSKTQNFMQKKRKKKKRLLLPFITADGMCVCFNNRMELQSTLDFLHSLELKRWLLLYKKRLWRVRKERKQRKGKDKTIYKAFRSHKISVKTKPIRQYFIFTIYQNDNLALKGKSSPELP